MRTNTLQRGALPVCFIFNHASQDWHSKILLVDTLQGRSWPIFYFSFISAGIIVQRLHQTVKIKIVMSLRADAAFKEAFMEMCCKSRKLASKCRAFFLFLNSSFTSLFILRRKGPGLFFFVGENIFLSLTPCSVLPQMVKVLLFLFSQNPKTIHLIKSRVSVP